MLSRTSRALVPSLRRNIAAAPASRAKLQHLVAFQQPPAAAAQHQQKKPTIAQRQRSFHTTPVIHKGITPESADPQAPNPQPNNAAAAAGASHVIEATPLSDQNYHEVSEIYLDELLAEVERVQEEGSDVEAEYSVCLSL
jgi:frataxin